jgi:hypothetical protein
VLSPAVKRMDVVGQSAFANNDRAFLAPTLRINRKRYPFPVDLDHEAPHFEIIAHHLVQQAASL